MPYGRRYVDIRLHEKRKIGENQLRRVTRITRGTAILRETERKFSYRRPFPRFRLISNEIRWTMVSKEPVTRLIAGNTVRTANVCV